MASEVIDTDLGWKALLERARSLAGDQQVIVGVLDDGSGGAKKKGSALTLPELAAVLEFGTQDGHIPARPALRDTFDRLAGELVDLGTQLALQVLVDGTIQLDAALDVLGSKLASEIRKTIMAGVSPPDAPATIKAKGSSRPLVDSGRLVSAIAWARIRNGTRAAVRTVS